MKWVLKIIAGIFLLLLFSPFNTNSDAARNDILLGHTSIAFWPSSSPTQKTCINLSNLESPICVKMDNGHNELRLQFFGRSAWSNSNSIYIGDPKTGRLNISSNDFYQNRSGNIKVKYKIIWIKNTKKKLKNGRLLIGFEGELYVEVYGPPPAIENNNYISPPPPTPQVKQEKTPTVISKPLTAKAATKELRYAKALHASGKTLKARKIIKNLMESEYDKVQSEAMYLSIIWGLEQDTENAVLKFKAYYPKSDHVPELERHLKVTHEEQERIIQERKRQKEIEAERRRITNMEAEKKRVERARIKREEYNRKIRKEDKQKKLIENTTFLYDVKWSNLSVIGEDAYSYAILTIDGKIISGASAVFKNRLHKARNTYQYAKPKEYKILPGIHKIVITTKLNKHSFWGVKVIPGKDYVIGNMNFSPGEKKGIFVHINNNRVVDTKKIIGQ